jgi:hypothetical protein
MLLVLEEAHSLRNNVISWHMFLDRVLLPKQILAFVGPSASMLVLGAPPVKRLHWDLRSSVEV